jgi:gas vesicle protein
MNRALLLFPILLCVSCVTTRQVVQKPTTPLPPALQQAQNEVWNLEFQLTEAQHDLALARINHQESDIQNRLSQAHQHNNQAQILQLDQEIQQLESRRSREENRLSLKRSWLMAVQASDMDMARSLQDEINHLP